MQQHNNENMAWRLLVAMLRPSLVVVVVAVVVVVVMVVACRLHCPNITVHLFRNSGCYRHTQRRVRRGAGT